MNVIVIFCCEDLVLGLFFDFVFDLGLGINLGFKLVVLIFKNNVWRLFLLFVWWIVCIVLLRLIK